MHCAHTPRAVISSELRSCVQKVAACLVNDRQAFADYQARQTLSIEQGGHFVFGEQGWCYQSCV